MKKRDCKKNELNKQKQSNKQLCDYDSSVENKINTIEYGKEYCKNVEENSEIEKDEE